MTLYRRLILTALILTFAVVSLGAYVRLSDAGLGCPDWPGCYGKLSPLHAAEQIEAEWFARPHGPVSHAKAWKEMVHRYFAGTLGLLVLGIAMLAHLRRRETFGGRGLPGMLLGLIVFQALLGMWTVTELLKPVVVTAHLLGGMATLAFLMWLWLRESGSTSPLPQAHPAPLRAAAMLGLALVVMQIALGGWVSTNYAALACTDFPRCHGIWMPPTEFSGFTLHRPLGETAAGELLSLTALTTIHWVHRVVALIVTVYLVGLVLWLVRHRLTGMAALVTALLLLQVTLGIANVLLSLPLPVAVAHNAGAAMLLASLVWLNFRLHRRNR